MSGIINATNLEVANIKDSTGANTAMTVDSSGRILTSNRPSFRAYRNTGSHTTGEIIFDQTEFNVGAIYNTSNGRFTAPIAGKYFLNTNMFLCDSAGNTLSTYGLVRFYKNGTALRGAYAYTHPSSGHYSPINMSTTCSLAQNDYVTVKIISGYHYNDSGTGNSEYDPVFEGFLIG